jgi:hypothetical protein
MAESKSLKTAVKTEVKEAAADAKKGNVETVKESKGGPMTDLPTGARSHPPEGLPR